MIVQEEIKSVLDEELVERKTHALEQLWKEIANAVLSNKIIEIGRMVDNFQQARIKELPQWLRLTSRAMKNGVVNTRLAAMVSTARFALNWLRADYLPPITDGDDETLLNTIHVVVRRVLALSKNVTPNTPIERLAAMLDPVRAASTPLSAMILGVYVRTYTSGARNPALATSGQRLVVMGNLGSGKSTITFWSAATILHLLGASWPTIMEYMRQFMVSTIRDYIAAIHVINTYGIDNGIVAPILVFDDAAVLLSKYSAWSRTASKQELMIATALTKQLQISREGIALLVFNTSDISVLAKGIRDTMDMGYIGLDVRSMWRTYTTWIMSGESIVIDYAFTEWQQKRIRRLLKKLKFGLIADMDAIVIPPLYMPSEMYMELQSNKVNTRRELSLKIAELGKELEDDGTDTEEEYEEATLSDEKI